MTALHLLATLAFATIAAGALAFIGLTIHRNRAAIVRALTKGR